MTTLQQDPPTENDQPMTTENEQPITTEENEEPVIVEKEQAAATIVEAEPAKTTDDDNDDPLASIEDPVENPEPTVANENIFQIVSDQDDTIDIPYEIHSIDLLFSLFN